MSVAVELGGSVLADGCLALLPPPLSAVTKILCCGITVIKLGATVSPSLATTMTRTLWPTLEMAYLSSAL